MNQDNYLKPLEQLITEIKANNDRIDVNIKLCHDNISTVFKKIDGLQKFKDEDIKQKVKKWHAANHTKL